MPDNTTAAMSERSPDATDRAPTETSTVPPPSRPVSQWRVWLGMALLVLGLVLPLVALVVVPLLGFPAAVNAGLFALSVAGGPDLLLVLSAAAMGKENIDRVLSKLGPKVKQAIRWDDVSRTRYMVGLWILAISLVAPIVIVLFFEDSVVTAGNKPDVGYYVVVGSTWAFIATFFIMGAPLWERIRALFTWDAQVSFPPPSEEDG